MLLDFVSILLVFIYFILKNKKINYLTDKKEGGCYKMIGCNFYIRKKIAARTTQLRVLMTIEGDLFYSFFFVQS